jgi:hypothetical protein
MEGFGEYEIYGRKNQRNGGAPLAAWLGLMGAMGAPAPPNTFWNLLDLEKIVVNPRGIFSSVDIDFSKKAKNMQKTATCYGH